MHNFFLHKNILIFRRFLNSANRFNLHISFSPNYTSAKICQKLHPDVACNTSRRRARDVGRQQKLRQDVIQSTSGGIGKGMYDVSQQNNETVRLLQQIPYKSPLIHT